MRRRDKRIEIYFNDDEMNKLDNDRRSIGLTRSEYLRALVLGNVVDRKNNQELLSSSIEIQKLTYVFEKLYTLLEEKGNVDLFFEANLLKYSKELGKIIEILNRKLEKEV